MKLVLKFKDGMTVTQDVTGWDISGDGNLLQLLQLGKEGNKPITVTDNQTNEVIERSFEELYSFEIVLA